MDLAPTKFRVSPSLRGAVHATSVSPARVHGAEWSFCENSQPSQIQEPRVVPCRYSRQMVLIPQLSWRVVMQVGSSSLIVEMVAAPVRPSDSIVRVDVVPRGTQIPIKPLS